MKAQRAYLYNDIAALERLVATLLTHLNGFMSMNLDGFTRHACSATFVAASTSALRCAADIG